MRKHETEVWLAASPEAVFEALHTPSAIREWWQAARVIVIPREGGVWMAAWGDDEDSPLYVTSATLAKFDPPRSLRFEDSQYLSHTGAPPFDMSAMSTEFTVTASEGGSRLVVVQDGFPEDSTADDFYAACEKGWHDTLAGLRAFFEKRGKAAASSDK